MIVHVTQDRHVGVCIDEGDGEDKAQVEIDNRLWESNGIDRRIVGAQGVTLYSPLMVSAASEFL